MAEGIVTRPLDEAEAQRVLGARNEAMEQIIANREQEFAAQVNPAVEPGPDYVMVDDPNRFRFKAKVDGEEREYSVADLIPRLQKGEAADRRLQEATERMRGLEERERELAAREEQLRLQAAVAPAAVTTLPTDEELSAEIREALNHAVDGHIDTAADRLAQVLAKGRQQMPTPTEAPDVETIAHQVEQRLTAKQVWEQFLTDNPEFRESVDEATGQVVRSEERDYGDYIYLRDYKARVDRGEISYQQALTETAARVKGGRERQPEAAPASPELTGLERRSQFKQRIDNIPVASGARSVGPETPREETRSEILAGMRKARGQLT